MLTDDLWDKLREDGISKEMINPIVSKQKRYLATYEDDALIGVQLFVHSNTASVEYHPIVLKEHRKRAREFVKQGIRWLFANTRYYKINAEVPGCVMTTINFMKKCGFTEEGIKRQSYRRDGELYSLHCLGITREECK